VGACKETFPNLSDLTVMVLGAGETAQLTVHYLASKGVRKVLIANRTIEKAQRLAELTGGEALSFHDFARRLDEADILICCTSSPHRVLGPRDLRSAMAARHDRPMLVVDLAVPRDVDPAVGELPGVRLLDIDSMQGPAEQTTQRRQEKLQTAESLVENEAHEFGRWLLARAAAATILELQQRLEEARAEIAAELAADLGSPGNGSQHLVDKYTKSLVRSLLRQPIQNLKELAIGEDAEFQLETARKLFGL
jgi:glutamyl-tRNA reductase